MHSPSCPGCSHYTPTHPTLARTCHAMTATLDSSRGTTMAVARSAVLHQTPRRECPASLARTHRSRAHGARGLVQPPRRAPWRSGDGLGRYARRNDGQHQPARRRPHRHHREQDQFFCRRAQGRHRTCGLHAAASRPHHHRAGDAHHPRRRQARRNRHPDAVDLRPERRSDRLPVPAGSGSAQDRPGFRRQEPA